MIINNRPTLFQISLTGTATRTRGVADPFGSDFACNFNLGINGTGEADDLLSRSTGDDFAIDSNTDYTVSVYAKKNGGNGDLVINNGTDVDADVGQVTHAVSGTWQNYSHTFNTGSGTVLRNVESWIASSVDTIDVDLYMLRIFKTADGDPIDDLKFQPTTTHFTDFSEYTTDAAPSDWTKRYADLITPVVRADGAFTGGKYLEVSKSGSGNSMLSWDAIDTDPSRDNGIAHIVFDNVGSGLGDDIQFSNRAGGTTGAENVTRTGIRRGLLYTTIYRNGLNEFFVGSQTVNTPISYTDEARVHLKVLTFYDAMLLKIWDDVDPEPATWNVIGEQYWQQYGLTDGWTGIFNSESDGYAVDSFEYQSGTPWASQLLSGTVSYNAAPVEGATVDLISVDQVSGAETVAETGLTTQADGTVTSSVSRDGAKEYYFRVYPFNLPISGLTGTLTATDATNLDLGVDLSALDTGQNRAYTIKATGGTGSGEVILIKSYTDKANGLVTVDYHPFGNDTTFEVCRLISGENASVLPRTS